jgi:hypothetical protein
MRRLRSQLPGLLRILVASLLVLGVSATPDALAWMQFEPESELAHLHEGQHDQLRTVLTVENRSTSTAAARVPWQRTPPPHVATPRITARQAPSRSPFWFEHGSALRQRVRAPS